MACPTPRRFGAALAHGQPRQGDPQVQIAEALEQRLQLADELLEIMGIGRTRPARALAPRQIVEQIHRCLHSDAFPEDLNVLLRN